MLINPEVCGRQTRSSVVFWPVEGGGGAGSDASQHPPPHQKELSTPWGWEGSGAINTFKCGEIRLTTAQTQRRGGGGGAS